MKYPNFREENKLSRKGCKVVVGIDEAGRGPLAGPVVACALYFNKMPDLLVKDSKQLSFKQREEIYRLLKKDLNVEWGIGKVSEKVIDKINILNATKLAMKRAVRNLKKETDFLLIDGNFNLDINIPQKSVIKGDQKVMSIAAASIVAKVTRDRMMLKYHQRYPQYCFDRHKGYGSQLHRELIRKYGYCSLHRRSFHLK